MTAPGGQPVSLAEAKRFLHVEHGDDDTLIGELITATVAFLDGPNAWLGRFIVQQTWDYKIDCFPWHCEPIKLPMLPVQSITSITYVDTNGVSQTLDTAVYQVTGLNSEGPAKICEAFNQSWPDTRDEKEAVTVRGVFGYPDDGLSPVVDYGAKVPDDLRTGILLNIKHWYETSGEVFAEGVPMELGEMAQRVLSTKRVWKV